MCWLILIRVKSTDFGVWNNLLQLHPTEELYYVRNKESGQEMHAQIQLTEVVRIPNNSRSPANNWIEVMQVSPSYQTNLSGAHQVDWL